MYASLADPLATGLAGVRLEVVPLPGDPAAETPSSGASEEAGAEPAESLFGAKWHSVSGTLGLWSVEELQPGWYAVTASILGNSSNSYAKAGPPARRAS